MKPYLLPSDRDDPESGFALVAVLWFLVLVSAVVASFAVAARTDFLISANARQKLQLDMVAEGIATALSLRLPAANSVGSTNELRMDSSVLSCSVGRYEIDLRVQDQAGLIDLNAADEALLAVGLRSIGVPSGIDKETAKAIVSFRSYQAVGDDATILIIGGRKAGPFESVVELSDFEPLKSVEAADLHRVFTVQSRQPLVLVSRSPQSLAELLQDETGNSDERQEIGDAKALAIEVSVRDRSTAIRGYAGFLVERSESSNKSFKRVEQLFEPAFITEVDQKADCPSWFHDDIAQVVAGPA